MKSTPQRVALLIVGGLAIALGLWWRSRGARPPKGYYASGSLEARALDLSVPLPVQVLSIYVQEGEGVHPGDTLMVLDTTDLALQYRSSTQTLRSLEARLRALDYALEQLERDYKRLQNLKQEAVPQAKVERTYTELQAKRAERQAVEAQKRAIEQQIARIRHQLQQLILLSPAQAQVQTVHVEVGEYATPGWPLITLLPLDTLEFHTYIPQALLPTLDVGDTVSIRLDIDPDLALSGWVQWIGAEAEYTPRNLQVSEERARLVYPVKVMVPNPDHRWKPGMTGVMRWGVHEPARRTR